jgi:tripartite ATP-independent transporter DctM subunit
MGWQLSLLLLFGVLVILFATGMPIFVAFILINILGAFVFMGGSAGLENLIFSIGKILSSPVIVTVMLFILMGEVLEQTGIAPLMIDTLDKWLGRIPGRLSLLAVISGTLIATLTGNSMASVAMLGSSLVPEMEKRGYKKAMSLGPIMGSGGLAIMIPPSSLAVIVGALGEISVSGILLAIILPGLLLAACFAAYIIIRCLLQPSLAPPYEVPSLKLRKKLVDSVRYILPIGLVVFMVIGLMLLGVASPIESAATGTIATYALAVIYRRLNRETVKKSAMGAISVSAMVLMMVGGAEAFGYNLGFSGVNSGLTEFVKGLPFPPIVILIAIQVIIIIAGMFMSTVSIIMIFTPLFTPIIKSLGLDPVWFAAIFLLNVQLATLSPPFGMDLFTMKAVAPPDTTMGDVYRAALPFCYLNLLVMALMIAFPEISLTLPNLIR